jgi:TRAP transporter TAXI family solute receptor
MSIAAQYLLRMAVFLLVALPTPVRAQEVLLFSVGSGDTSGNYYPAARALCDAFNASDDTRRRCSPEPTPGSIYNLEMLGEGQLDLAVVQSDWLRAAFKGDGPFARTGAKENLRVVMPLFPEAVTIITTQASGIETSRDLIGKVVDIGRPASGRNATIRFLLDRLGMGLSAFGSVTELDPTYAVQELCAGHVDAVIFVVGHPSALIRQAIEACDARIVDFIGPNIEMIAANSADYRLNSIDLGLYGRPGEKVRTIAVMATLVARADVESSTIADLVQAVEADVDGSIAANAMLGALGSGLGSSSGLSVPLHAGVVGP